MTQAQQSAIAYLMGRGVSKDVACGIVGVLTVESNMDPTAVGDGGTSIGLAQWHLTRRDGLNTFATKYGLDPTAANTQLHYVLTEAANSYPAFWATITSPASTYQDVVTAMVNTFEIPADPAAEIAKALPIAAGLMTSYVAPTPVPTPTPVPVPTPTPTPVTPGVDPELLAILKQILTILSAGFNISTPTPITPVVTPANGIPQLDVTSLASFLAPIITSQLNTTLPGLIAAEVAKLISSVVPKLS